MTEEVAFYYNKFKSQWPEAEAVLNTGDSLDLVLDDSDGAETMQYRETDFNFAEADAIIAVELDAHSEPLLAETEDTSTAFVTTDAVRMEDVPWDQAFT